MSNLYLDSNFYIYDVTTTESNTDNPQYTILWAYTSNNKTMKFSIEIDSLITNVHSKGAVTLIGQNSSPVDKYQLGNAFTTPAVSPIHTSNTGTGLTVSLSVSDNGYATYEVVNPGFGYNVTDQITFDKNDFHRSELIVGGDFRGINVDVQLGVDGTDKKTINYFPSGLSKTSVAANAAAFISKIYGL